MPGQSWTGTVTDGSSWVWPEPVCVWAVCSVQVDSRLLGYTGKVGTVWR